MPNQITLVIPKDSYHSTDRREKAARKGTHWTRDSNTCTEIDLQMQCGPVHKRIRSGGIGFDMRGVLDVEKRLCLTLRLGLVHINTSLSGAIAAAALSSERRQSWISDEDGIQNAPVCLEGCLRWFCIPFLLFADIDVNYMRVLYEEGSMI